MHIQTQISNGVALMQSNIKYNKSTLHIYPYSVTTKCIALYYNMTTSWYVLYVLLNKSFLLISTTQVCNKLQSTVKNSL